MKLVFFNNRLTAKILSVFFSFLLWLNVTANEVYDLKISVPIKYIGAPENLVITSKKPSKAIVGVKGSGKKLLSFYVSRLMQPEDNYVYMSLSGIHEGKTDVSVEKNTVSLSERGLQVVQIVSPENGTIPLLSERKVKKTVPVVIDSLSGFTIGDKYAISGRPVITPEFVRIEGPESTIKSIASVSVKNDEKKTVTSKNKDFIADTDVPVFVNSFPDSVKINFPVEEIISLDFRDIPISFQGFRGKNRSLFKTETVSVSVSGPQKLIEKLDKKSISVTISYRDYLENRKKGNDKVKPAVKYPQGITGIVLNPEEVHFDIK